MKSRLLVSLMVIAMAAALIGGATMAWFTDSATSEDVTLTAGTLLIDIDNFNRVDSQVLNLDNLNPGDSYEYRFDVKNVGTKRFYYKGFLCYQDIVGQDREDLPVGMVERLEDKGYGTDPLSEVLIVKLRVVGNTNEYITGELPGTFYVGTLADYVNSSGIDNPPIEFGEAGPMSHNDTWTYSISIELPEDAGNEYQGSQLKAAFVILARQIHEDAEYGEFVCPFEEPEV